MSTVGRPFRYVWGDHLVEISCWLQRIAQLRAPWSRFRKSALAIIGYEYGKLPNNGEWKIEESQLPEGTVNNKNTVGIGRNSVIQTHGLKAAVGRWEAIDEQKHRYLLWKRKVSEAHVGNWSWVVSKVEIRISAGSRERGEGYKNRLSESMLQCSPRMLARTMSSWWRCRCVVSAL